MFRIDISLNYIAWIRQNLNANTQQWINLQGDWQIPAVFEIRTLIWQQKKYLKRIEFTLCQLIGKTFLNNIKTNYLPYCHISVPL